MSQHDMVIADQSHTNLRADLNNALQALVALSSGATEPSTRYAYMLWADTTTGRLKQRNAANTAWIDRGSLADVWSNWKKTIGTFTATPASTSTLTMTTDMTASILVGMGLKYVIGGVTKYGRVAAITANLLTVNGAPLSGDVTDLYYDGGTIRQVVVIIPGNYEDASNTALIASDLKSSLIWALPLSYCVHFKIYSNTHDTGAHGQASVQINNTELCTTAGGLTIAADATYYNTVVDIDVAAYDINHGEAIEVTSVKAGNGDASDLTVEMIFLTP